MANDCVTDVKFLRVRESAVLPTYATAGAVGMDLYAAITKSVWIEPFRICKVPIGWKVEIPEGYEGQIRARSGLAAKYGISVINGPGTIDSDFRGELWVILTGLDHYEIKPHDRIAQLVIAPVSRLPVREVLTLSNTERGEGGFGSTGV